MSRPSVPFWDLVDKQPGGCWLWTGARESHGYGQKRQDGRKQMAHRLAYEEIVGPIPPGLELDHLCRNRACVNPAHLAPVTHAENIRRGQTGAHHRAKTHCPAGHPYSPENTYWHPAGYRRCRECHREQDRKREQRQR